MDTRTIFNYSVTYALEYSHLREKREHQVMKEQLIDKIKIYVKGGDGGNGCVSFFREKFVPRGGPDGGTGGGGGHVYLEIDEAMTDLLPFKYKVHFKAKRGQNGMGSRKNGKRGDDIVIGVPRGTIVYDAETGDALADIVESGERFLAARGGRGGRGNAEFASSVRRTPKYAEKGEPGEERWLILELKLLADVGIIGFPNAGKSTLLSKISAANPRIASYPFTTLSPNLGVVTSKDGETAVVADVPGLIEGAHQGAGLGLLFLRHIERTNLLLHMIDISEVEPSEPFQSYAKLRKELELYKPEFKERPEIVVFNKKDLVEDSQKITTLKKAWKGKEVFFVSCTTGEQLPALIEKVFVMLRDLPAPESGVHIVKKVSEKKDFTVKRVHGRFIIEGKAVERMIAMTDMKNEHAVEMLQRKFKYIGVEEALTGEGAKEGDTIIIGNQEFDFLPDI